MESQFILGDCFDILPTFPANSFNAIITDPPYKYLNHKLDANFNESSLIECALKLLSNGFFVFFGRGESFYTLNYLAINKGFTFKEEIIWDKLMFSGPLQPIGRCHETISLLSKNASINKNVKINKINYHSEFDSHKLIQDINRIISSLKKIKTIEELTAFLSGVYPLPRLKKRKHKNITVSSEITDNDRGATALKSMIEGGKIPSILRVKRPHFSALHPTQKPVELLKKLIELTTPEGAIILDPFAGSGTLAIAALETGRRYVCIEKEVEYYDIAMRRIEEWHNTPRQWELDLG